MKNQRHLMSELAVSEKYSFVGGPFGSKLTSRDYVEDGVPVIRGANMGGSARYVGGDFVYVSERKADTLTSNMAFPGDVVFTQRGTLGQIALVPPPPTGAEKYVVSQSQMKVTVDESKADPRYLYYYFTTHEVIESLKARAITSGVPHINLTLLRNFDVALPDVIAQRRIADILSTYDDLIENNNRRMALLEESIHLLYREWFVYLRFPGHERVEVRDGVPEGWTTGVVGDVLMLQRGYDITKKQQRPGPYPVVSSSGVKSYHAEFKVHGPGVVIGRKGTLGSVHYVDSDYWPHDTSLWVRDFKGKQPFYVLCLLQALNLARLDGGGANPSLNRNVVHAIKMAIPPMRLVASFDDVATPAFHQRRLLQEQNRKLREARDLLLPRLMDGRIPV